MSDSRAEIEQQIAELEADLRQPLSASSKRRLEAELAELRGQLAVLNAQSAAAQPPVRGTTTVADSSRLYGNAIGVNQGTVQNFFGTKPSEDAEGLLADYLDRLKITSNELRLSRILKRDRTGADRAAAPAFKLQDVYTSLTIQGTMTILHTRERTAAHLRKLLKRLDLSNRSSDKCAPEDVRSMWIRKREDTNNHEDYTILFGRGIDQLVDNITDSKLAELAPKTILHLEIVRDQLVFEAIARNNRLILLGEPGYGKSTVLRYLAHLLARRGRGEAIRIPGWSDDDTPVPVLLSLGSVAAALEAYKGNADHALWDVLGAVFDSDQGVRAGLQDQLKGALRRGGVLLLLDGLDELPAAADGGARMRVAKAIQRLVEQTGARAVVTSRVLPYRAGIDWQFPVDAHWIEQTIQSLSFGQVRTFVKSWYRALVLLSADLNSERADAQAEQLIAELEQNTRLRPLVQSPLLLTMLTLLHYNSKGNIPRDRARLYDECVQLLLERWEPVRGVDLRDRSSRLQQLLTQLPSLEIDKLRDVIHELAFTAQQSPPGDDGRGVINRDLIEGRLRRFFKFLRSANPDGNVDTLLEIIREEAGLLVARDDETAYAFPHLTFQEYLAACWLADQKDAVEIAYSRWVDSDRERWRQVLLLFAGRLRQKGQKDVEREGVELIKLLSTTRIQRHRKQPAQRRRDAVLAALCYAELGGRSALSTSMLNLVQEVEKPLRAAIIHLLKTPDASIGLSDRIAAAEVLGDLDDPRFPITIKQWRAESFPSTFGKSKGYWCYVREETYRIGGWREDTYSADITLPSFWIARFPITVAQYTLFIQDGGYAPEAESWWTPNGWSWKLKRNRLKPNQWDNAVFSSSNQPVAGVTWYEANAYCAWLNAKLIDVLPNGYSICIPSEAEWETAAAYDEYGQRHSYPWGEEEPTLERAIYDESGIGYPAPVGCCPAGAAACGALDIVGNVWEWAANGYMNYPKGSHLAETDLTGNGFGAPLRGSSYYQYKTNVNCMARYVDPPGDDDNLGGFRIVVAPRSKNYPDSSRSTVKRSRYRGKSAID